MTRRRTAFTLSTRREEDPAPLRKAEIDRSRPPGREALRSDERDSGEDATVREATENQLNLNRNTIARSALLHLDKLDIRQDAIDSLSHEDDRTFRRLPYTYHWFFIMNAENHLPCLTFRESAKRAPDY